MIDRLVAAFVRRRRARWAGSPRRQRVLDRPVISVGNLSMGGSGKTPLVAHVARLLHAMGHAPAVLSRGYARPRPVDGAVVVSDGHHVLARYEIAGDEPFMLARQLPGCCVVVSPDRYLAGAIAERRLGCSVHVLDDGFQHLQLARNLDLLVVTPGDLEDRVMPKGRLREPLDAIGAAHACVVDGPDDVAHGFTRAGARRVFTMSRQLAARRDEPVFAFAGIGRPAAFFDALRRAGWSVTGSQPFADHYAYSAKDLERIADAAARAGARVLVTTEKDAARLQHLTAPLPIVPVTLALTVEPAAEFAAMLREAAAEPDA